MKNILCSGFAPRLKKILPYVHHGINCKSFRGHILLKDTGLRISNIFLFIGSFATKNEGCLSWAHLKATWKWDWHDAPLWCNRPSNEAFEGCSFGIKTVWGEIKVSDLLCIVFFLLYFSLKLLPKVVKTLLAHALFPIKQPVIHTWHLHW